ncbi:O-antigen polymerase [Empedobacter sp.]|uniref:O-antigen polymerase n=1 Tax=Empedobacter sp. TaxID=1927715 RepID=UPI0028AACF1B|nr:O-antigen polymerase [Empedobacter sp.]
MILLVCFLSFLIFSYKKGFSIGLLLILLFVFSISMGVLIGKDYKIENFFDFINFLYMVTLLFIVISPWLKYKYSVQVVGSVNKLKLFKLFKFLCWINGISFFIFLFTAILSFQSITNYSEFKNGEGSIEFFANKLPINQYIYLLAVYIHSSAYLLIPIHLYYLLIKKYKYSLIALLFSLNIILQGLTIFSRSGFISYFLCYIILLPFFYFKFDKNVKKKIRIIIISMFSISCFIFYTITENRFTDTITYDNEIGNSTLIKSPTIYSLLDYGSQWFSNSREVMSKYNFDVFYGRLTFTFPELLLTTTGFTDDLVPIEKLLKENWGSYFDKFNGLAANLLFDLGYVGAILFALIYRKIVLYFKPKKGIISIDKLIGSTIFVMIPAMSFFNSEMKVVFFNLAIIYSFLFYKYLKIKLI